MLAEAAGLLLRGRMAPDTYFLYRLFDPDVRRKETYISEAPAANERMWSAFTPARYGALFDNKYAFRQVFQALPLAKLYGVYDERLGFTFDGGRLTNAGELHELVSPLRHGFVFKPVEGVRGYLTLVFGPPVNGELRSLAGEPYDAERIVREARDTTALRAQNKATSGSAFMVEERMRPHPELAELLGPTFCTARVLTIIARDGSPQIVASVFKLQTNASGVDNMKWGSMISWVAADGTLGLARTRFGWEWVDKLPNGKDFIGFKLPQWDQVKDLALSAARVFPWARAIGWDIGISDRGPVIIEGNERWGPGLLQVPAPHGIMDGELKALYDELE